MQTSTSQTTFSKRSLPDLDPRLAEVGRQLDDARAAAALLDQDLRLVWVSEELRMFFKEMDTEFELGQHIVKTYMGESWAPLMSVEDKVKAIEEHFPVLMYDTPGGKEGLKKIFLEALREWVDSDRESPPWVHGYDGPLEDIVEMIFAPLEPVEPAAVMTHDFDFLQPGQPPTRIGEYAIRLVDEKGERYGCATLFAPALPARLLSLVTRGDEALFSRMANLTQPGRRAAAILFADLQDSGVLSRRLPSSAYFQLICALTTAIDEIVVAHQGIVGKHAGDGVTAFFLEDDLGSSSAAAHAAVAAARAIAVAAGRVAKEVGEETGLIEAADGTVNVGLHWSSTLYMGQLITGGRLEVTALGDQVNECARIQETARNGEVLASKGLVEHLDDGHADAVGVDPTAMVYRTISELPEAPKKAIRDAGGIAVTPL